MFGHIDKADKTLKEVIHRNYYLTQGDSFTLTASPVEGDASLISKIVFKIGTLNDNGSLLEMYSQDYVLLNDGVYYLTVSSETTKDWAITEDEPYTYEIEVHYVDGGVNTVEQSSFTVWNQIRR